MTITGISATVIVAYNSSAERRRTDDYESAKKRFLDGCAHIAKPLEAYAIAETHMRRPPTGEDANRKVFVLISDNWREPLSISCWNTFDSTALKIEKGQKEKDVEAQP